MEELVVIVLQILGEILFEVLLYCGIESAVDRLTGYPSLIACVVVGAIAGGVSLAFSPKLLLPVPGLRLLNLFLGPAAAGGLAYLLAARRRGRGTPPDPWGHFWHAYSLAFAFDAARLAGGVR